MNINFTNFSYLTEFQMKKLVLPIFLLRTSHPLYPMVSMRESVFLTTSIVILSDRRLSIISCISQIQIIPFYVLSVISVICIFGTIILVKSLNMAPHMITKSSLKVYYYQSIPCQNSVRLIQDFFSRVFGNKNLHFFF